MKWEICASCGEWLRFPAAALTHECEALREWREKMRKITELAESVRP